MSRGDAHPDPATRMCCPHKNLLYRAFFHTSADTSKAFTCVQHFVIPSGAAKITQSKGDCYGIACLRDLLMKH